jgi:uroporphyrin-III C-methyltransferase/precorrin-2 dehydrogenase/sirohydrochlorin ferrochelatase
MDYLPIFLDVRARVVVVVGGGPVAARKVHLLLQAGARVRLVAPSLVAELRDLVAAQSAEHVGGRFELITASGRQDVLEGAVAAIAATNDPTVNAIVAEAARVARIPVNVVDDARLSTFIVPALVDRSPVIVAIGTAGQSPVLARHVRARIEQLLHPQLGRLASFAGRWRQRVRRAFTRVGERRRFWERILESPVAERVLSGQDQRADFEFRRALKHARDVRSSIGEVYLVGAGPGDPDLLTLRAARLLQQADVILYDRLVSPAVLDRARRDAERIFVGKEAGKHHVTQERTQELLLQLALEGKRVCRLKGGDPFIFGRGGEELEALAQAGIPVTVVPGITAALGAAASAGIPLTHRDHAHSVTFLSGHFAGNGKDEANDGKDEASEADPTDWSSLARAGQTAVFYMAVSNLPSIVSHLRAAGAPAQRPAAIVENATLPNQRIVQGTLADIVQLATGSKVASPALLVVGEVAGLRLGETSARSGAGHVATTTHLKPVSTPIAEARRA